MRLRLDRGIAIDYDDLALRHSQRMEKRVVTEDH